MRTIKFRGKSINKGEWFFGDLIHGNIGGYYILPIEAENLYIGNKVIHETIGQYTGLQDKNGVEIYEGDILHFSDGSQHVVMWDEYECGFNILEYGIYLCEVIGNIHDNPELLKEELL